MHLQIVKAVRKSMPSRMTFPGQTYSLYDVTLQPRTSGYLLATHYRQGMPVKKGQLLIELDKGPLELEVTGARSAVASALSQLTEAQNNYDRSVPLARINAVSQSSLDLAAANLAAARANLMSTQAALESAELNLSYATIYSPCDGIIGETVGWIGDYVGLGTEVPVINTISNIDSVYVYLSIPASTYYGILHKDSLNRPAHLNADLLNDIEMELPDGSTYPYKGVYAFTERMVNNQTGAVTVRVLFPNPEMMLKPGQYAKVHVNVGKDMGVVLVPQRCIIQTQGQNAVYVVGADSTVQYRKVTLGDTFGSLWGIADGVADDEMVLVEGLQKVHNGMKVVPVTGSGRDSVIQAPARTGTQPPAREKK